MGTFVTIEILRVEKNKPPRVLKRLRHSTHSLEAVFASTESVIRSPRSPAGANAFHIEVAFCIGLCISDNVAGERSHRIGKL